MPHLPVEIDGGSITISVPVVDNNERGIKAKEFNSASDEIPAAPHHVRARMNRFHDSDARIYKIEVRVDAGSEPSVFFPAENAACSVKIYYASGEEPPKEEMPSTVESGGD